MIAAERTNFNEHFSEEKYQQLIKDIDATAPGMLDFRVAETPVFVSPEFRDNMLSTCDHVINLILQPDFKELTKNSIPKENFIPGETPFPELLIFDFGVCKNKKGELEPQLIEMQGFPSLFTYQHTLDELMRDYASIPREMSSYLNGFDSESYVELLKKMILADCKPHEVVLMEVRPEQQKTRIDFRLTEKLLGIKTICVSELRSEGRTL